MEPERAVLWCAAGALAAASLMSACHTSIVRTETAQSRRDWASARMSATDRATEATAGGARDGACVPSESAALTLAKQRQSEHARREGRAAVLEALSATSLAEPPTLRISELRLDRFIDGPARAELALRVPIERPGTLDLAADGMRLEAQLERARGQRAQLELELEVALAWANRAHWAARLELARVEAALVATARERLHTQRQRGEVAELDLVEMELLSARIEGEVAMARGETARWDSVLSARTGQVACDPPEPPTRHGTQPHADGLDEARALVRAQDLLDMAFGHRPEVAELKSASALAEVELDLAERQAWPWFEWVQVGYERVDGWSATTWGFALAIELPFGRWDGTANRAARTRASAVEAESRRVIEGIAAEVEAARAQLAARLESFDTIAALVARLPAERLSALPRASGELLEHDLLGVARDRLRLERLLLEARLGVAEAKAQLVVALGGVGATTATSSGQPHRPSPFPLPRRKR